MSQPRLSPDEILKAITKSVRSENRGKLKIFLGGSAGVGKTYSMLSEAHEQLKRGVDVLIGFVETHGRKETDSLVDGLPLLPNKVVGHGGTHLEEFDLDAALVRKPTLIIVDELAHTNAPGSRHPKRWLDIQELLDAGIDVYTAVNIQHLESLNDVVAQVTGVIVKETVPDAFFEEADRIELVDVPPEELQQRIRDGKVYVQDRIAHALDGFFRKGNLIALRELALRRVADRVDADMQSYRVEAGVRDLWQTRHRIIVCIAPNQLAQRVVRAAARIGAFTHAELIAVYVESDRQVSRPALEQDAARAAIELAEQLGMETVLLRGHDIVGEILHLANARNASLVIVGKPIKARWKEVLYGSVVDEIVRNSGDIDVHVITGRQGESAPRPAPAKAPPISRQGVLVAILVTLFCTLLCQLLLLREFGLANLVMIYLLGVAFVSSRYGRIESIIASVLSVLAFDIAFVPPRWSFAVSDSKYLVTFGVMMAVGLLISSLSQQLKSQLAAASERERRTAALYALSKKLSQGRSKREVSLAAAKEIRSVFEGDAAVYYNSSTGVNCLAPSMTGFDKDPSEEAVGRWALEHESPAGLGTDTLPGSCGLYLPLTGSGRALGYVGFSPKNAQPIEPQQRQLLETFINGLGMALERAVLAKESNQSKVRAETERMRSALLGSISHDLRTPLTAIGGAASSLVSGQGEVKELASTIYDESVRLNMQIENLLDMTNLQSGRLEPNLDWQSAEELIGIALARTQHVLGARKVTMNLAENLPLIFVDGVLVEKALTNILENVGRHTRPNDGVTITAFAQQDDLMIEIADSGPGFGVNDPMVLCELGRHKGNGGFGLGLAICKAVVDLHKGRIELRNGPTGGAVFRLWFPLPNHQPQVSHE